MTREDIIRMARECSFGWAASGRGPVLMTEEQIERFAALVAAAEREKHKYDGIHTCHDECPRYACVATREAVAAEREACASLIEDYERFGDTRDCAKAIRARGQA